MLALSSKIVAALRGLGISSLPILKPDHLTTFLHYPAFLKHLVSILEGLKESVSKATHKAGEQAVRQATTQIVAALHQGHPQLSLLSELEGLKLETLSLPEVTRQAGEILERLAKEDDL